MAVNGQPMRSTEDWKVEVMDGAPYENEAVLVMEQPGNSEKTALSSTNKNRCFSSLSHKSSLGYTVIGYGIVLENDRSDETKHISTVVWRRK